MKKQYAFLSPQLMGRVLVLALALLIVICIDIGAFISMPSTSTAHSTPTPPQNTNTIHYDNIQETPLPGSVQVRVTLAEYTFSSSLADFRDGLTYHTRRSNAGQEL